MESINTASRASDISGGYEDEISLSELVATLLQHARLIVIGSLSAALLAVGISLLIKPTFTATTRLLSPQQQSAASALTQQLGALAGLGGIAVKTQADTYVAMLQSRNVAERVVKEFDLVAVYEVKFLEDALKELAKRTKANIGKKDGVISISVDDHDPARAAAIANFYVQELKRVGNSLAIGEASQRRVFFEDQLKAVSGKLADAELALRGSGVGTEVLKANPEAAAERLGRLQAGIAAAEVKLGALRTRFTDATPEVRQVQQELNVLRSQLARVERDEPASKSSEDYIARYREFKYQETLFELIAKQYELARLDEARDATLIQVIDTAVPPERKSKPKRAMIVVASTMVAFLVLCLFVLLRHGSTSQRR